MGNVDLSILNDLTAFDSATVQNAAIRIRGYINESDDYTGTSLKRYTGEMPTIVGVATTVKAKAFTSLLMERAKFHGKTIMKKFQQYNYHLYLLLKM